MDSADADTELSETAWQEVMLIAEVEVEATAQLEATETALHSQQSPAAAAAEAETEADLIAEAATQLDEEDNTAVDEYIPR